jgi:hypothetical protein
MIKKIILTTLNEEFEKGRGKDKVKRKSRSTTGLIKLKDGSTIKIDKNHPMYERGKWDAIKFSYVPDFKNDEERMHWAMGFNDKKGFEEG